MRHPGYQWDLSLDVLCWINTTGYYPILIAAGFIQIADLIKQGKQ
jgi:hypothetical protein